MNKISLLTSAVMVALAIPSGVQAQTTASEVQSLHTVLENVYDQMMPLCAQLISVARGIAGFAATFYIGYRVWKHIANAEAIDFFPLFRPFVLAILIGIFPNVLGLMNGILKPTVTATAAMVTNSNQAVQTLLAQRENALKNTDQYKALVGPTGEGDREKWYAYTHNGQSSSNENFFSSIGNDMSFALDKIEFNIRYYIKLWISQLLQIIYYAASLCIDTIRTFHLIVLAILGPLVFGLSVFDGFQHSLTTWLARYINIYLWLPVANLFGAILGKIQENMLQIDLGQLQTSGDTFFTSTDAAYLIFMIIGIIGYFTVPSVANYIVHAHGSNVLVQKVTNTASSTASTVVGGAVSGSVSAASWAGGLFTPDYELKNAIEAQKTANNNTSGGNDYQRDKVSGS
ncbi:MAG TPA: conjugative transposon protein TraJ [Puia sp.]|nr:conjugative transposon protein TraJ [Puia sp.]